MHESLKMREIYLPPTQNRYFYINVHFLENVWKFFKTYNVIIMTYLRHNPEILKIFNLKIIYHIRGFYVFRFSYCFAFFFKLYVLWICKKKNWKMFKNFWKNIKSFFFFQKNATAILLRKIILNAKLFKRNCEQNHDPL